MTKFDPTKPVVYVRNGFPSQPARIICRDRRDAGDNRTIVALIDRDSPGGRDEHVSYFTASGEGSFGRLVNIPEKRTVWRVTTTSSNWGFPSTSYFASEYAAKTCVQRMMSRRPDPIILLEPPHPFEYEVPE